MDSSLFIPNLSADLSTILSEHSTIFIKSYGNGTLSTPSFRGTSAQHTQVEWNGINLNSPMLGQTDFSQIPVAQFEGLEILYGAAGISRTSGAFGGVIDLVTAPDWNNQFKINLAQSLASFDNYITNMNIAAGSHSFQSHTKVNYTSCANNFPYTTNGGDVVRQRNASFQEVGLSQELFWKVKDKHLLSAKIWYSQDDRNLPPTTQTFDSLKIETLKDKALRAVIEYKYIESKWNLQVRSALNDQNMEYKNNLLGINSTHLCSSWINRMRLSYIGIRNLTTRLGVDFTYDWVNSDEYDGIKTRTTTSFFSEINYNFTKKIKSSLVLREDIVNGKFIPLIPALGFEYRPFNKMNLAFSFNMARNYRYPTLNELYWKDLGNPDLHPEMNYSIETGGIYNFGTKDNKIFLEASVAAYYSWIFDMITWSIVDASSVLFKPHNIDEINARGIELGLNLNLIIRGFNMNLKNNYNFCRSTYEKVNSNFDNKIGNQQIFIPVSTLNSTFSVERWRFYLSYNFTFTGERYTGKDNLSLMPAYNLSNIIFGKNIHLKLFVLSLQIDINNLFNLDYQSIPSRPMPGINYALTLKLAFASLNRQ
ncbi:MAG: TonB-dependent receptor plug domain-containing protein [Bacteroidetes bacterium]|nr:TonB-dependent receptor plug domain-containing protein [Bacteroidota bacterium]